MDWHSVAHLYDATGTTPWIHSSSTIENGIILKKDDRICLQIRGAEHTCSIHEGHRLIHTPPTEHLIYRLMIALVSAALVVAASGAVPTHSRLRGGGLPLLNDYNHLCESGFTASSKRACLPPNVIVSHQDWIESHFTSQFTVSGRTLASSLHFDGTSPTSIHRAVTGQLESSVTTTCCPLQISSFHPRPLTSLRSPSVAAVSVHRAPSCSHVLWRSTKTWRPLI